MGGLDLPVRFFFLLGFFHRLDLRLGQHAAWFLAQFGLQRF